MTVPEYSAGDWTAVVRPGFVALLGPQVPQATVRAVWAATDAGVLGVLALLAREGFEGLPPFAIVAVDRRRLHVALRGDVEVEVGAEVLIPGEVSTWSERVVDDAPGVVVRTPGAVPGAELPIAEGVVRASAVRVGFVADEAPVAADVAAGLDAPAAEPDEAEPAEGGYVEPERMDHALVALEPLEDEEPDDAARPGGGADPSEPVGAAAVTDAPDLRADAYDAPPVVPWFPTHATPDPEPADVVAAAEALLQAPVTVEGASPDDHDGMTIMSADLASIRDQLPAWAADDARSAFTVPTPAAAPARIVLSTGVVVELDRAVLVGRAPQVARVTNSELPRLVTVPSPQQDISRTHAEVRSDGDVVLVTDLDSTNGVHVARPGQGARRLHPGEPSVVEAGEVVDLGDGVTFTVERGT
ncbi:FHA domain-containing protein [Cellulomonas alba]|uniref:FHA domain-containing protein n=1 Tax=Cellulomonas alba TaxID=3053467 RepID=A0ABT7SC55_9CELL|nr:FHA domain-containing protein [Cellulomonas alba]MDM7853767.1 FHA domain-containing protein [Cellulomonas alba]